MPLFVRRRSSSFRPHNWTYPVPVHPNNVSLEQLPITILNEIFSHLHHRTLLDVAVSSKYFYLPAAIELYRKIVLTDNQLGRHHAENSLSNWHANYGTSVYSLDKLVEVVASNDKLAELVSIIVVSGGYFDNDEHLLQLIQKTHVKQFYFKGVLQLPSRLLGSVQRLLVRLPSSLIAPNLTKLEIHSRSLPSEVDTFRSLAMSLIDNGVYQNIDTLLFSQSEDRNISHLNLFNTLRNLNAKPLATWIAFIDVFQKKGAKMSLKHLALHGFLSDTGNLVADLLSKCIDMDILESLEIHCTEVSHQHSQHYDSNTTILKSLTKHTKALKRLALNPTYDCLSCQVDAIINALTKNLEQQLTTLLIVLESPNALSAHSVKEAILNHQHNLEFLKWNNRGVAPGKVKLYRYLSQHESLSWEHNSFYELCIKEAFFPEYFLPDIYQPQITVDQKLLQERQGLPLISEFMNDDHFFKSLHRLPKLTKYQVFDFTVVPSTKSLLVNGEEIKLIASSRQ